MGPALKESPEFLLAESNHRIANNLTLLAGLVRLQASSLGHDAFSIPAEDVRQLLGEISGRLEAVGRLHRLLGHGGPLGVADLGAYLRAVAEAVLESVGAPAEMQLSCEMEPGLRLSARRALCTGLAVSELVTNAIKHARTAGNPSEIRVTAERQLDVIMIRVADNGPGPPPGFQADQDGGLGMRLLHSMADQLEAKLEFLNGCPGLIVQLRLSADQEND